MSDWQPIETAPKDGTRIDLWVVTRIVLPGGRFKDAGERLPNAKWLPESRGYGFRRAGWFVGDDAAEGELASGRFYATHWMPLPSPPEQGK